MLPEASEFSVAVTSARSCLNRTSWIVGWFEGLIDLRSSQRRWECSRRCGKEVDKSLRAAERDDGKMENDLMVH